jgi:hypothetical protein
MQPDYRSYAVGGFIVKVGLAADGEIIAYARVAGVEYTKSFAPFHWLGEKDPTFPEGLDEAFNEARERYKSN